VVIRTYGEDELLVWLSVTLQSADRATHYAT